MALHSAAAASVAARAAPINPRVTGASGRSGLLYLDPPASIGRLSRATSAETPAPASAPGTAATSSAAESGIRLVRLRGPFRITAVNAAVAPGSVPQRAIHRQHQQQQQQQHGRLRGSVATSATKQTFSSFQELVALSDTVLVDFYATWCGPCQLMAGVLQEVAGRAGDQLRIVKIDTEKYPKLASQYGIEALPTLLLFHKGKVVDRLEGALPADQLLMRIQTALSEASRAPSL